jgi:hypothetical protein
VKVVDRRLVIADGEALKRIADGEVLKRIADG